VQTSPTAAKRPLESLLEGPLFRLGCWKVRWEVRGIC